MYHGPKLFACIAVAGVVGIAGHAYADSHTNPTHGADPVFTTSTTSSCSAYINEAYAPFSNGNTATTSETIASARVVVAHTDCFPSDAVAAAQRLVSITG
jgi:hypothetical protein